MSMDYRKIVLAGVAGTAAMTMVGVWGAPMMGLAPMNPANMLAGAMGGSLAAGWALHLMIGIVLALGYAMVAARLAGPAVLRGAVFAVAPWLMAQVVVMPMMGMPLFSGSVMAAMGSLIGHLVYGAVIGAIVGRGGPAPAARAVRRAA
ncbi:MAG: hypothetical protein HOP28_15755 [Gemmatimonadales bacterium]|nr:hypothetical protein [Gemmatimonadales bacterium]